MSSNIHHTAIVGKSSQIASDVIIGPYCVIGENVKIESGTILKSHVVIEGDTIIGKNNIFFPFSVIGVVPQDLKFKNERAKLIIGDNNKIREHVTIHIGTEAGRMLTEVGNNSLLMVGVHIAHDCKVGNNVILANNATLAGHVEVEDDVVIGGLSAVHQFVRIGKGAMVGGMSGVESDVIPYGLVMGERASLAGLNLVGMKRQNIDREEIHSLRLLFKRLFLEQTDSFANHVLKVEKEFEGKSRSKEVISFLKQNSSRSFCHPKNKSKTQE